MLLIKLVISIYWSIFAQDATCHLIIMSFAESSFYTVVDVSQLLMYCNLILGPVTSWRAILQWWTHGILEVFGRLQVWLAIWQPPSPFVHWSSSFLNIGSSSFWVFSFFLLTSFSTRICWHVSSPFSSLDWFFLVAWTCSFLLHTLLVLCLQSLAMCPYKWQL